MAITQTKGALAAAGKVGQQSAQSVANALGNLATLQYTGGGSSALGQGKPKLPAPTYSGGGGTQGSFSSGGSAAAAQHIIQTARNQQAQRQNVFNDVAKLAVQSALAVASGMQPGRTMPSAPVRLGRVSNQGPSSRYTPAYESQMFDQQIQATKTGAQAAQLEAQQYANPNVYNIDAETQYQIDLMRQRANTLQGQVQTMRNDPRLPIQSSRIQAEMDGMRKYPQMTAQDVRGLSDQQLDALLHVPVGYNPLTGDKTGKPAPRYDPLSGDKAGTPRGAASAAGNADTVGGGNAPYGEMSHNGQPFGPPPQPPYSVLPTWDTTRGAPPQPPYSPLPSGAAMVSAALLDALGKGKPTGQTQGGQMADDDGGGWWGRIKDAGEELAGLALSPLGPLGAVLANGQTIWEALGPSVKEGYEAFLQTDVGRAVAWGMEQLDRGRQENAENYGQMFTQWANGETIAWTYGGIYNPVNDAASVPIYLIGTAWEQADPNIKEEIKAVSEQGYSSPSYVKVAESQGIDPVADPEFTGDRAVWEFLMSKTDDLPNAVKYPLRMMIDTVIDPLTYAGGVAALGAEARATGIAMRTAEGSTTVGRTVGGILEGTGAAVEGAARLPDLPVEGGIKVAKGIGGKTGEITGLLSPSTAGLRREADAAMAEAPDLIAGARASVPDTESRISFDAETQGVAPTSGPELIETPTVRADAPTVVAREGGGPTVSRSAGTATVEEPTSTVEGVRGIYPTFETLADSPSARAGAPSKIFDYNGTPVEIRPVVSTDGRRVWAANFDLNGARAGISRDSYSGLLDELPSILGGTPRSVPKGTISHIDADGVIHDMRGAKASAPSKAEIALRDLDKQIKDAQAELRSGNPDRMMVAAEKIKLLLPERDRLRGEIAAEKAAKPKASATPPPTKAEREAAAAAGGTPETPRSTGASETVRAAESAKDKVGTVKRNRLNASDRKTYGALAKAEDRAKRLAKEDREGLPKEVNKILAVQKPGEHEFSPIYGGHRPLDRIVTKAIDSGDPAQMKKADAFVKKVDQAVEQHLRTDNFYKTWKNGGVPIRTYTDRSAFADDFFEAFRSLEPDADIYRLRVLANGLAKGTLDDIAELQFQLGHLFPMLIADYADEFTLQGALGAVGRIESRDFKAESSRWLIREYLDTPSQEQADKILHTFLTGETEVPVIADGVHKPYAHSIVPEHQAESIARLQQMRAQWRTIKRAQQVKELKQRRSVVPGPNTLSADPVVDRLRWRANKDAGVQEGHFQEIRKSSDGTFHSYVYDPERAGNGWMDMGVVPRSEARNNLATGWATRVDDFSSAKSIEWGRTGDNEVPPTRYLEFLQASRANGTDDATGAAADAWLTAEADRLKITEMSDAAFRDADIPAQLEGGKKSTSRQIADAIRKTRHSVAATDEAINTAIGEIKDAEIAHWLMVGDNKLTVDQARLLDRAMPESWRPPGYVGDKTSWNVKEAVDWAQNEQAKSTSFDMNKALSDIGAYAHGLQPKMTPAQVKAAQKAAEAAGIDPKTIRDGASMGERAQATKAIRALDWKMRNLRALRLYNVIIGLGNRIGDIAGNSMAHLVGRDPRAAFLQVPKTFTEANALRRLERDPAKLNAEWVKETPHMAETGMSYRKEVLGAHKLSEADPGSMLPPMQGKLEKWNAPRGLKWLSNAWTAPYLKDMTTAGEMVGRKLSFDRVYTQTIQREAWPAFKEYLEGRFPGQSDQLLKDIYTSAQEKGGKSWSGYFSAGDVKKAVDEDAARVWQGELNRASDKGAAEAEHLFFKGKMTNADEIARRTLTFHFWMVRASALYGRTLLRNPVLLSGFYRMHEEAQQIAEEQGLPGWLGTMYKFMAIPGAGSGYVAFDPINAIFPLFFLDMYSQEGNKLQAFQNLLIPEWSAALGAIGLTQNVPDLTGTRSLERFVIDMGNFLKGEGVDLEAIPLFGQYINTDSLTFKIPTEEFTKALIEKANGLLGQPLGDFKPFDRAANEHDQLYSIGEQIGQGLWGEDISQWTSAQIDQLTQAVAQAEFGEGEDTWLSETIRAAYGREGAARAFGALAIPGGVVTRQEFRDSQLEQAQTYWSDFYAGKPPTKAGESAAVARQLATSAQPAWVAMNNDYYKIGTKQEQSIYGAVNDMLYSPGDMNPNQSIIIDNGNGMFQVYSMAQLAGLSDEDRKQVVNAWMAQNQGVSDAYTLVQTGRDQFKADHPDYAAYSEYQKGVYGYQGGPSQFRKDMADNPTFKAAEDAQRAQLKKEGKTGAVLEAELDHWATTQQAFFAATGQKYKVDDQIGGTPGPSSVAAMFSLRPDKETSGSGGTKEAPKDPNVDDYWSPEKGVPRLAQDQAQYEHDNAEMERRFGPYWNQAAGDWEDNADSTKERDALGIGDKTYVYPSVSETMRRYEVWEEEHPGGSPEEFFAEMLQTEGFGKKVGGGAKTTPALPGGTVITQPVGVAATAGTTRLQGVKNLKYVTNAPRVGSRPEEAGDAAQVIQVANSFVGQVPYVWGAIPGKGETPTGWDCSGMTYWLDQNYGSGQLPMGSHYQYQYAQQSGQLFTDMSQLQPGDIVFIDTGWQGGAGAELNRSGHVGIYAGNGQLINALNPDAGTVIEPLSDFQNILGAMHGSWNG